MALHGFEKAVKALAVAEHLQRAEQDARVERLWMDHAQQGCGRPAAVGVVWSDVAVALGRLDVVVERDDENIGIHALVDLLDDARMVERVDDQRVDSLFAEFIDHGTLLVDVEAAHAAPDDLEAVGVVLVCEPVHGVQDVIEEVDAFRKQQDADDGGLLASGERLARRVGMVVEFGGHFEDEPLLFRLDLAAAVEHAVDCAARDAAEFGNLFDGYHRYRLPCCDFAVIAIVI